jgi:hypothetical protein
MLASSQSQTFMRAAAILPARMEAGLGKKATADDTGDITGWFIAPPALVPRTSGAAVAAPLLVGCAGRLLVRALTVRILTNCYFTHKGEGATCRWLNRLVGDDFGALRCAFVLYVGKFLIRLDARPSPNG